MKKELLQLIESNQDKLKDPFVQELFKIIEGQATMIEELKAEINRLKKRPSKPSIKASTLEKRADSDSMLESDSLQWSKKKRSKKAHLPIDREERVKVPEVGIDWEFKGYKRVMIQEIKIERENTLYLLEVWRTPEGKYIYAQLPACLQGTDFGPMLKSYILCATSSSWVTRPIPAGRCAAGCC